MKKFNVLNAFLSLVAFGLAVHAAIQTEWVAALLLTGCSAWAAWQVDWRGDTEPPYVGDDPPLPVAHVADDVTDTQTDILRRGHEPVETPTDEDTAKVQTAWDRHVAACEGCQTYYRLKKEHKL